MTQTDHVCPSVCVCLSASAYTTPPRPLPSPPTPTHKTIQHLPADTSQAALEAAIAGLNRRPDVHGIMVEQPFPRHLLAGRQRAWAAIDPAKVGVGLCVCVCVCVSFFWGGVVGGWVDE